MGTTIIDLEAQRQRQAQTQAQTLREELLHLRLLGDCLGDIEIELRQLIERLEEHPRKNDLRTGCGIAELSDRVTAIAARLVATLAKIGA